MDGRALIVPPEMKIFTQGRPESFDLFPLRFRLPVHQIGEHVGTCKLCSADTVCVWCAVYGLLRPQMPSPKQNEENQYN